jgi:hypothetical protein
MSELSHAPVLLISKVQLYFVHQCLVHTNKLNTSLWLVLTNILAAQSAAADDVFGAGLCSDCPVTMLSIIITKLNWHREGNKIDSVIYKQLQMLRYCIG